MLSSDIRYAVRSLWRQKFAAALVVAMLTLGIAANVAVFSLVNGLFLRPFPFPEPERLVFINEQAPKRSLDVIGVNFPDFDEWRKGQQLFEAIAAWDTRNLNLADGAAADRVTAVEASYEFADVLGVRPVLGRMFTADEDKPGAEPVVVLGHGYWLERFTGRADVLGHTLKLNGQAHVVIGVLPPHADAYPGGGRVWIPLRGDPAQEGQSYSYNAIGRLEPGVTLEQAEQDLLRAHQPIFDARDHERIVTPLVLPLGEINVRDLRTAMVTLTGAVALLLLVSCFNVAAVVLARALGRRRDMGIRLAIGAGRLRIVRQLFVENLLLALVGGASGLALGQWAIHALVGAMADVPPAWAVFGLDTRVAAFALAAAALTALLFGWAPALHASRGDPRSALHTGAAIGSPRGQRTLRLLIGGEFALATLLLVFGGLLFRAYARVQNVDPGFIPEGVLTFGLSLPPELYREQNQRLAFWDRVEERLTRLAGVRSAAVVNCPPFGCHRGSFYVAEGGAVRSAQEGNPVVLSRIASPGYFATLGIRLKQGRFFNDADGRGGPSQEPVVIINDTFARTFFPDVENPVGRRIRLEDDDDAPWSRIVGTVADVKHYGLEQPVRPGVYVPLADAFGTWTMRVALKTDGDPASLVADARAAIRELDPELPLFEVRTMDAALRQTMTARTTYSSMLAVFAVAALVLALGGAYGVSAYLVTQRTREIGIRVALGAVGKDIVRSVLGSHVGIVAAGIAIGTAGAVGVARLLESLLFGVAPYDAPIVGGAVALLALSAAAANILPALRAARVNPTVLLRAE
jgi:putative ABC transport system permease protein